MGCISPEPVSRLKFVLISTTSFTRTSSYFLVLPHTSSYFLMLFRCRSISTLHRLGRNFANQLTLSYFHSLVLKRRPECHKFSESFDKTLPPQNYWPKILPMVRKFGSQKGLAPLIMSVKYCRVTLSVVSQSGILGTHSTGWAERSRAISALGYSQVSPIHPKAGSC